MSVVVLIKIVLISRDLLRALNSIQFTGTIDKGIKQ